MNLKHLRVFVEVARQGSFTRAAERLSLSQPALTIAMGQLEEQIGLKLFDRTTRRVSLTTEGESFLPTVERLVGDFDAAISDMKAVAERRLGHVSVAALPSVSTRLLPSVMSEFARGYPGIRIHLHDSNASGVQLRVKRKEVDFGIASLWEKDPELDFQPILRDRFAMVCRKDHALGQGRGSITWRELSRHPFLGLARDTGIWSLLEEVHELPEAIRAPRIEVSNIATLEAMVEAGLGVTALPLLAMPGPRYPDMMARPLKDPVVEREICLITRRGRALSPVAETLRARVLAEVPTRSAT